MTESTRTATAKDVKDFFGITSASQFMKEWKALSETDQEHIKSGLSDGSFDYTV